MPIKTTSLRRYDVQTKRNAKEYKARSRRAADPDALRKKPKTYIDYEPVLKNGKAGLAKKNMGSVDRGVLTGSEKAHKTRSRRATDPDAAVKDHKTNIDSVFEKMEANIVNKGVWPVGSRIPTESELEEMFGTSRISIKQAISRLSGLGYLIQRQGSGTYVTSNLSIQRLGAFAGDDVERLRCLVELRQAIEPLGARLAAAEDCSDLPDNLGQGHISSLSEEEHALLDWEFHKIITEKSQNPLLFYMEQQLFIPEAYGKMAYPMYDSLTPSGVSRINDEHKKILEAVKEGRGEEAEGLLREHLTAEMDRFQANRGKYFIRGLLSANGVSYDDLRLYGLLNRDEILHINDIFSQEKEEDVRQCAGLLWLLCQEYADEVVAAYLLNGDMPEIHFDLADVEQYKHKLLAGLEYNDEFFTRAWNWRTSLKAGEMKGLSPEFVRSGGQGGMKPRSWPSKIPSGSAVSVSPLNMMQAASISGNRTIHHERIDHGKIHGELFGIDRTEGKIEFYFRFEENQENVPYLKIHVSGKDIPLKEFVEGQPDDKRKTLRSGPIPMIDRTAGISIDVINGD
jgi:DNA-binding FadR family transcriptional regulator